jgi:hypothetical protein
MINSTMAFACVYVLAQQANPSSAKNAGKERAETVFRLFRNNINQQMMDYRNL